MDDNTGHELITRLKDEKSGLDGWIAIHSTKLGPATGGTRYLTYATSDEALDDALRLSRAMTYKCALAGVPFGGGKAVIIANQHADRVALLRSYALKLNLLRGSFSTGEDVGMTDDDIQVLAGFSPHVNRSGDPSPWAALGVFHAIRAALAETNGTDNLTGKKIAIKGLGKVGLCLAKDLANAGAVVIGADTDKGRLALAQKEIPSINIVSSEDIRRVYADVYAPCALGNEFTTNNVAHLKAKIICGAANNQLAAEDVGTLLHEAGMLYVPDYLANAGGLINVVGEQGHNAKKRVIEKISGIFDRARDIIHRSREKNIPTNIVANSKVKEILMLA